MRATGISLPVALVLPGAAKRGVRAVQELAPIGNLQGLRGNGVLHHPGRSSDFSCEERPRAGCPIIHHRASLA